MTEIVRTLLEVTLADGTAVRWAIEEGDEDALLQKLVDQFGQPDTIRA